MIFFIFVFFKASNFNVDSIRKINNYKINALKVKRVQNTFENLNSSEMTLKILKMMQIYQKCNFGGFRCFLAIFDFFEILSKAWVKIWVATTPTPDPRLMSLVAMSNPSTWFWQYCQTHG
jgi:hypothetical protein